MTTLPNIIGQPPTSAYDEEITHNALPVMEIEPMRPEFETAATLFTLHPDWENYNALLKRHKFSLTTQSINLAYVADNFPTDSFTNQYSESFLNRFTDLVSTGAAELSQITGQRNAGDAIRSMLGAMEQSEYGAIQAFGKGATGALTAAERGFKSVTAGMGDAGNKLNRVAEMTGKLLGGYRVDMPMIWKNSGFTPSYTITVRLYNPFPGNAYTKEKYIIGPIAAILLLALPQTDDGVYYNWPFFCRIKVPGMLYVPSAYIGNVTLVKGGDQQQITYSQEMGMVDVRIEFGSLYDTMVVGREYKSGERPTLENYLNNLREKRKAYTPDQYGSRFVRTVPKEDETEELTEDANIRQNQGTVDTTSEPPSRVSAEDADAAEELEDDQPQVGEPQFGEIKTRSGVSSDPADMGAILTSYYMWDGNNWVFPYEGRKLQDPSGKWVYCNGRGIGGDMIKLGNRYYIPGSDLAIAVQEEYDRSGRWIN